MYAYFFVIAHKTCRTVYRSKAKVFNFAMEITLTENTLKPSSTSLHLASPWRFYTKDKSMMSVKDTGSEAEVVFII